jgi:hypothetical protein
VRSGKPGESGAFDGWVDRGYRSYRCSTCHTSHRRPRPRELPRADWLAEDSRGLVTVVASVPPDLTCPNCSKPIRDNSVVVVRQGELFHIRCRSAAVALEAMEAVDRAQRVTWRSQKLAADVVRRQADWTGDPRPGVCPLCGQAMTVSGGQDAEWLIVAGCLCGGFFVWNPLFHHLASLNAQERTALHHRIRSQHAQTREAWLATRDGLLAGPLIVSSAPPRGQ